MDVHTGPGWPAASDPSPDFIDSAKETQQDLEKAFSARAPILIGVWFWGK